MALPVIFDMSIFDQASTLLSSYFYTMSVYYTGSNSCDIFNREQLIAGAVLGEVFFVLKHYLTVLKLKLCLIHGMLHNKCCQNRFLKCTQCSAVLRILLNYNFNSRFGILNVFRLVFI